MGKSLAPCSPGTTIVNGVFELRSSSGRPSSGIGLPRPSSSIAVVPIRRSLVSCGDDERKN